MQPGYELFDHTTDMGIRVRAGTYPELLQPAANGLYAVIGELAVGGEWAPVTFAFHGDEPALLLRDYLAELLILFERNGRIVTSLTVEAFDEHHLTATTQTQLVDPQRSDYHREVKAITYHKLDIRPVPGGYEATFIVDI